MGSRLLTPKRRRKNGRPCRRRKGSLRSGLRLLQKPPSIRKVDPKFHRNLITKASLLSSKYRPRLRIRQGRAPPPRLSNRARWKKSRITNSCHPSHPKLPKFPKFKARNLPRLPMLQLHRPLQRHPLQRRHLKLRHRPLPIECLLALGMPAFKSHRLSPSALRQARSRGRSGLHLARCVLDALRSRGLASEILHGHS